MGRPWVNCREQMIDLSPQSRVCSHRTVSERYRIRYFYLRGRVTLTFSQEARDQHSASIAVVFPPRNVRMLEPAACQIQIHIQHCGVVGLVSSKCQLDRKQGIKMQIHQFCHPAPVPVETHWACHCGLPGWCFAYQASLYTHWCCSQAIQRQS